MKAMMEQNSSKARLLSKLSKHRNSPKLLWSLMLNQLKIKKHMTLLSCAFSCAPGMGDNFKVKVLNGGWLYQPLA
jgi:hypothetical protein